MNVRVELESLEETIKKMWDRKNALSGQIGRADKEINDLYHYIEFSDLNASQGYKAYKMLHDCLTRRRELKDEFRLLEIVMNDSGLNMKNVNHAKKKISKEEVKHYNPRILNQLFDSEQEKLTICAKWRKEDGRSA